MKNKLVHVVTQNCCCHVYQSISLLGSSIELIQQKKSRLDSHCSITIEFVNLLASYLASYPCYSSQVVANCQLSEAVNQVEVVVKYEHTGLQEAFLWCGGLVKMTDFMVCWQQKENCLKSSKTIPKVHILIVRILISDFLVDSQSQQKLAAKIFHITIQFMLAQWVS